MDNGLVVVAISPYIQLEEWLIHILQLDLCIKYPIFNPEMCANNIYTKNLINYDNTKKFPKNHGNDIRRRCNGRYF